jgi:LAO/AO transport system kinase
MQALDRWRVENGHRAARRAAQARAWFEAEVRARLLARLEAPAARARMATLGAAVAEGAMTPGAAAEAMLAALDAGG